MPKPEVSFDEIARQATRQSGHNVTCDAVFRYNAALSAGRFRLDNGLTIIFAPDKRAPVFAYQTWFRVGSRDEHPERTGIAHLFEHLMFKGTKTYPAGELDKEMERRGSVTNAATWVDWTFYTEALAARDDNLETVVRFEVDRMRNLVLDEDTFRSELEVVKNERRMSVDNSVVGTLSERVFDLAYRVHPYRWPTIGSMAHLEAATLEELERFYRAFYAPNNAVVVFVGDSDPVATMRLLAESYGPLESQTVDRPAREPEPEQTEPRHLSLEMPVVSPQMIIGYRAPGQNDPDFATLEMLNDVLTGGDSGRLYRRLVTQDQIANEVTGYVSPFAEPGLYEIFVTARPGVAPERIIDVIQEELDSLKTGAQTRELNKARHGAELGVLESLRDAESCAESLGHYETNYGDFTLAFRALERFSAVSSEDIGRVAASIFTTNNRSTVVATAPAS